MSQFRALNSMPEWLASKGTGDSLGLSFHLKTGTNGYGMLDSFPIPQFSQPLSLTVVIIK